MAAAAISADGWLSLRAACIFTKNQPSTKPHSSAAARCRRPAVVLETRAAFRFVDLFAKKNARPKRTCV